MEILKISETSIKITLCKSEAEKYHLSDSAEIDTKDVKKTFSKLLLVAKNEVGFNFAGENIVAEIFSSKDGGYEIFVSCIEKREETERKSKEQKNRQKQGYMVENIDMLLSIFARLKSISYMGFSAIYYDKTSQKYYIILDDVSKKDIKYAFLFELSRPLKLSWAELLSSRLIPVCKENAINELSLIL